MAARSIPATATKASGQLVTGALWNAGPGYLASFLLSPPLFRGRQSATQSIGSGVLTAMTLDLTDVDTDGGHSNVTNNSRYTCQVPGWYWVEGYVAWSASGGASLMTALIAKNGTSLTGTMQFLYRQTDLQAMSAGGLVQLAAGDYVEVKGQQNSGITISTFAGSDLRPCMNVFWVSK